MHYIAHLTTALKSCTLSIPPLNPRYSFLPSTNYNHKNFRCQWSKTGISFLSPPLYYLPPPPPPSRTKRRQMIQQHITNHLLTFLKCLYIEHCTAESLPTRLIPLLGCWDRGDLQNLVKLVAWFMYQVHDFRGRGRTGVKFSPRVCLIHGV